MNHGCRVLDSKAFPNETHLKHELSSLKLYLHRFLAVHHDLDETQDEANLRLIHEIGIQSLMPSASATRTSHDSISRFCAS